MKLYTRAKSQFGRNLWDFDNKKNKEKKIILIQNNNGE